MFYIFDNNTGLCVCSSPIEVHIDGTTAIETEQFYNTWEIQLVNGEIKPYVIEQPEITPDEPSDNTGGSSKALIFRIKHGDAVFSDTYPADKYKATIVSFQMADDRFNSPNVGAIVKAPEFPLYRGSDYLVGINSDGIAYCKNNSTSFEHTISGWITVVLESLPAKVGE